MNSFCQPSTREETMIRPKNALLSVLVVLLSIPLLLSGCATMGPSVEKPTVSVTDLRIQEVKALEAIFMLELRVMNPNDFPLDIQGINCDLKLDDKRFATGISDVRQEVPAFGTATVPVTVYASMFDMVGSVIQMLQDVDQQRGPGKPLYYELAGKVRIGGHGGTRSVPFQSEGEINLGGQNR
jgi:LEA14-like dessication related protein